MNRKNLLIFFVVIVLFIAALAGLSLAFYLSKNSEPSNKMVDNNTNTNVSEVKSTKDFSLNYNPEDFVYSGQAPVYVTIYSHNEDSWAGLVNTEVKYRDYRAGLVERADLLAGYNIDWDWQSDQPVVEAMIKYEDQADLLALTGGQNILKYLQSKGASLDPHAHFNNYADIAYLMEKLDVTASGVIGGTVVNKCGQDILGFLALDSWHTNVSIQDDGYVYGEDFPEALWKPEILSDPGMGQHWFDEWSSGVWQPGDADDFYVHDPKNEIIYIGEGYPHDSLIISGEHAAGSKVYNSNGEYIKELVSKIKNKELPTGTKDGQKFMYTASIHIRDMAVVNEGDVPVNTVEGLTKVLEELKPLRAAGEIIFVDFTTAANIWQNEYQSVPWKIDLSSFSIYEQTKNQAEEYCASVSGPEKRQPPINEDDLPLRSRP